MAPQATKALTLAVLAGLAVGAACAVPDVGPAATWKAFARAVSARDEDKAWDLLSRDTQAWLQARAAAVAAAAPGVLVPSARQLLVGSEVTAVRPLASAVVVRESRDRAVVRVTEEGGATRDVELVNERGWRVRIPEPAAAER